jgi:arginyl-tRNA synthetase
LSLRFSLVSRCDPSKPMESARELITKNLKQIAEEIFGEKLAITLEIPQDNAHGDYSCNVALVLSKKLGKNPREIAKQITEAICKSPVATREIEKVEVAGPGFLNFFQKNISKIIYLRFLRKKIAVENLTKTKVKRWLWSFLLQTSQSRLL